MTKQEAIYCEDDGEFRVHRNIRDKLCIERFYKNYLKTGTHINSIHKTKHFKKTHLIK